MYESKYKSKYLEKIEARNAAPPVLEGVVETKAERESSGSRLEQLGFAQQAAANQQLEGLQRAQRQQSHSTLLGALGAAGAAAWFR